MRDEKALKWLNGNKLGYDIWNNKYRQDNESFKPKPVNINAVHPIIPKIVANTLFLYRPILRIVILLEKLILFQIKGIFSSKTRLPFFGAFGLINSAGFSFNTLKAVIKVAPTIHTHDIKIGINEIR